MFTVWIIAIIALIVVGIRQASEVAFQEKVLETQYVNIPSNDTLKIHIASNNKYDSHKYSDFRLVLDQNDNEIIYSGEVKYYIKKTTEAQPFVVINKNAEGNSLINAKKRAEQIKYNFKIEGNQIRLDNHLLAEIKSKYRNQSVRIEIFIPEKQIFFLDESFNNYWHKTYIEGENYNSLNHDNKPNHTYVFEGVFYKCLDCIEKEKAETPQIINDTLTIHPQKGRLEIGSDGTIIKKEN